MFNLQREVCLLGDGYVHRAKLAVHIIGSQHARFIFPPHRAIRLRPIPIFSSFGVILSLSLKAVVTLIL